MIDIEKRVNRIGQQLINDCYFYTKYADLICEPEKGIIPRALSYQMEDRKLTGRGSVIVGLNPGSMIGKRYSKERKEIKSYREKGMFNYKKVDKFLKKRFMLDGDDRKARSYYSRLRELADELNLRGPILWTEIVKCESLIRGRLSTQTIRDDINRYLLKEVELTPKNWPLIGVGDEAYKILSYYFNDRLVIGVPHVTGVRNNNYSFSRLLGGRKDHRILKNEIKKRMSWIIRRNLTVTVKLLNLPSQKELLQFNEN